MKAEVIRRGARQYTPGFRQALAAGIAHEFEGDQTVELPIGFVVEHPEVWRHCVPGLMNSAPLMAPADEECAAAVRRDTLRRQADAARLKQTIRQIADKGGARLKPEVIQHYRDLATAWSIYEGELDELIQAANRKPSEDDSDWEPISEGDGSDYWENAE